MKREELWTPSARRFECLLKAAQNGDYNAYMSLMARFFKVMDDKARNNYLCDYEMFTALVERVSEAQPEKGEDFYHYDVGNQLNINLKPLQANEAGRYGQHGSDTKAGQLPQ